MLLIILKIIRMNQIKENGMNENIKKVLLVMDIINYWKYLNFV